MYVYLMLHEGSSKVEETARRANIATKLGHNSRLLGSAATHSNSQHQSVGEQNPRARLGECPLVICRTSIWYGGQAHRRPIQRRLRLLAKQRNSS